MNARKNAGPEDIPQKHIRYPLRFGASAHRLYKKQRDENAGCRDWSRQRMGQDENLPVWDFKKVKPKLEVVQQAKRSGHFCIPNVLAEERRRTSKRTVDTKQYFRGARSFSFAIGFCGWRKSGKRTGVNSAECHGPRCTSIPARLATSCKWQPVGAAGTTKRSTRCQV